MVDVLLDCGNQPARLIGRAQKLDEPRAYLRVWLGHEIQAALGHSVIEQNDGLEDTGFRSAFYRHLPDGAFGVPGLRVVQVLMVRRLRAVESAVLGYLNWGAATRRHFPDLVRAASIRGEIDPTTVSRPNREEVLPLIIEQALNGATFRVNDVNLRVALR